MPEYKSTTQSRCFSFRIILAEGASNTDSDKKILLYCHVVCQRSNIQWIQSRNRSIQVTPQNFWTGRELQKELQFYCPCEFVLH